jgi:hypothetical protein
MKKVQKQNEKSVLLKFKSQVKGFIKWQAKQMDDCIYPDTKAEMKQITAAKTFEDVEKVLKQWDGDGLFMSMVQMGYF